MSGAPRLALIFLCLALPFAIGSAQAQDMEPKAYSASPVGANFIVGSYSWSTGAIIFDATLPVSDIHADVQGLAVGVGHTFNLFGKLGLATVAIPGAWADVTGKVYEQTTEVTRNGFADMRLKLSTNLVGNPAMSPREFAKAPRRTIVGASLSVTAPSGQYYPSKLINLGANRWAFKPEIGVAVPKGRWDIDAYVGAWLFATNSDFFPGGMTRTQDAMLAIQGHGSYTLRPRLWIALDGTWYRGGSARVNNGDPTLPVSNARAGVTLSMPVGDRYSLKLAYSRGAIVRTGTDFSTFAVAWQALWLSPRWSGR
jgi:outer membrane putative beta-barrel porin/alpha-amylase